MSGSAKKNSLLRELKGVWENGMLRALFLLVLVLVANIAFQQALVFFLRTERPLHTPISGSMLPTLKIGDLLIIQGGLSAEDIYANPGDGDIIIFRDTRNPNGIPIVHRAIAKFEESGRWYFTTKGDNNASPDRWPVPEDYLLGRVIFAVPLLGYFLRFLDETEIYLGGQSITLRMVLIVVLILAFFFLEYTSTSETEKETRKNRPSEKEDSEV